MAEDADGESEEVQLLREMVVERDKKIKEIRRKLASYERKHARYGENLKKTREEATGQRLDNRRVIADVTKRRDETTVRVEHQQKEVMQQNGSLHVYADVLNKVKSDTVDSSYVVRMQSQLCKAMHSMGILEHQLGLVKKISAADIKHLKDGMNGVVEDKSQMELQLMNDLVAVDDKRRGMEESYKNQIQEGKDKIEKASGDETQEDDEEEDDDDEEDDEEEEEVDEDLLREIVEEKREELRKLEEAVEQQAQRIKEMKAKLQGKAS